MNFEIRGFEDWRSEGIGRAWNRGVNVKVAKGDELQHRLVRFAARVVRLARALPKNEEGRHISKQILRSGTAPAANYGEARGAESRADFIHKLRVVLKELNETSAWLEIVKESRIFPPEKMSNIQKESRELCYIIAASIKTATKVDR